MAYAVVRTDNMFGTDVRAGLVSVKYIVTSGSSPDVVKTETAIENGNVLKLGAYIDGSREVFEGGDVAANTPLSEVVLIASPEVNYDERKRNLDDYINEAGKICRGYRLYSGSVFSVTKEALIGEANPKKGDIVELADGTNLKVVSSPTSESTVVGKIGAVESAGRYTYYVINVD